MTPQPRIGDVLVSRGVVTPRQLTLALEQQRLGKMHGKSLPLGEILIQAGFANAAEIHSAVRAIGADSALSIDIPGAVKRRLKVAVVGVEENWLIVAPIEPLTPDGQNELLRLAQRSAPHLEAVREVMLDRALIFADIASSESVSVEGVANTIDRFNAKTQDGALMRTVLNELFLIAMQERASDIYIDRLQKDSGNWVFLRVDGVKSHGWLLTPPAMARLVTHLKNEAGLDAAQRNLPQDGRIHFPYQSRRIDVRVASLPQSSGGERITCRLIDPTNQRRVSELLADSPEVAVILDRESKHTGGHNMIVLAGPTGSGKTTTLNAMLLGLPRDLLNIMTAEDPIEYETPGVVQTQVNEAIGLTFPVILRAHLRSAPDVLVVGETRDGETAEIAIRSSVTGHTVFTSLHTSTAWDVIPHLASMPPENYRDQAIQALGGHLRVVMHQKLVRRLCVCAEKVEVATAVEGRPLTAQLVQQWNMSPTETVYQAVGCPRCSQSGYLGRVLAPELLYMPPMPSVAEAIRLAVQERQGRVALEACSDITHISRSHTMRNLVRRGATDLEIAALTLANEVVAHA